MSKRKEANRAKREKAKREKAKREKESWAINWRSRADGAQEHGTGAAVKRVPCSLRLPRFCDERPSSFAASPGKVLTT
jgi:hypothetical protein